MVSALVLTAAPVEALPWPVVAIALVAVIARRDRRRSRRREMDCLALDHRAGDRVGRLRAADRAARGADVDVLQRLRVLPVLRRHLHDDVVLVERIVDRRDLALAEGVVERVVDHAGVDAEPRRGRAVDHQIGLEPLVLLVGVDVAQLGQLLQRLEDLGRPGRRGRRACRPAACIGTARCSARPPTRISCTACRNSAAPGTCASLPRSRAMTWSAETLRSASGFSEMKTKPRVGRGRRR